MNAIVTWDPNAGASGAHDRRSIQTARLENLMPEASRNRSIVLLLLLSRLGRPIENKMYGTMYIGTVDASENVLYLVSLTLAIISAVGTYKETYFGSSPDVSLSVEQNPFPPEPGHFELEGLISRVGEGGGCSRQLVLPRATDFRQNCYHKLSGNCDRKL